MAKKVPCLSKFFARYQDIFGQWFVVTPNLATTEPPGKLDLETLRKKVSFSSSANVDLSRGGVYDPGTVDDLITYLEGSRRQDVVLHQIADQVGSLSPGQYITPRLMFPLHTLPGGSWHTFILGKLWGAIRGLGEIFSSIFGLLIVGWLIWYLVKVLMNCSYIHSVHGCSAQLAWSFCTEVFFTRLYRRDQRQQEAERSDDDPSSKPRPSVRSRLLNLGSVFSPKRTDDIESGNPDVANPLPMQPLRRSQSISQIRRHTDSTNPSRIQSQLDRAFAAFQPLQARMSSPAPPDYVNDPIVGLPLEATRTKPSAPVNICEAARDGTIVPPVPARAPGPVGPATRVSRTPNRFLFTPIPTPRSETPPTVPARDPNMPGPSSDDPASLPSR